MEVPVAGDQGDVVVQQAPVPAHVIDPDRAALVRKLVAVNQAAALQLNLSPELLATRRDLEQLAEGRRDVPVLIGWRRQIIGERLLAAL